MRYVTIPDPIQLTNRANGNPLTDNGADIPPWTFHTFLLMRVLSDPGWGSNYAALRDAMHLDKTTDNLTPGAVLELTDDQWKKIVAIVERPQTPLNPIAGMQLMPFMDAVILAGTEP